MIGEIIIAAVELGLQTEAVSPVSAPFTTLGDVSSQRDFLSYGATEDAGLTTKQ